MTTPRVQRNSIRDFDPAARDRIISAIGRAIVLASREPGSDVLVIKSDECIEALAHHIGELIGSRRRGARDAEIAVEYVASRIFQRALKALAHPPLKGLDVFFSEDIQ